MLGKYQLALALLLWGPLLAHGHDFALEVRCLTKLERAYRGAFYQLPNNLVIIPSPTHDGTDFTAYTQKGVFACDLPPSPSRTKARIKYYWLSLQLDKDAPTMLSYAQHSADPNDVTVSPIVSEMPLHGELSFSQPLCKAIPELNARNLLNNELRKMLGLVSKTFRKDRSFTRALMGKDSYEVDYLNALTACEQVKNLSPIGLSQLANLPLAHKSSRISRLPSATDDSK